MATGIYIIENKINKKYYIGSTTQSFERRFYHHKLNLRRGTHHSIRLQRAWDKYGEDNFIFDILEEYPKECCASMEQWWITMTGCYSPNVGYNICRQVGTTLGYRYSPEQKKHISEALQGKFSKEKHPMWGKKRPPTTLGYKHTLESIERMKDFQKNRSRSLKEIEHWKALRNHMKGENHPNYGKKFTGEELKRLQGLRKGIPAAIRRPVIKYDLDMNFIEEYECLTYAARANNIGVSTLAKICKDKRKGRKTNFLFRYKDETN